jgi:hypothetical protein
VRLATVSGVRLERPLSLHRSLPGAITARLGPYAGLLSRAHHAGPTILESNRQC